MDSQNQFFSVMAIQVFLHFKNKSVVRCHYPLKSALLTVIKAKVLWRDFARLPVVKSGAIRIRLADQLGLRSGQVELSLLPWIVSSTCSISDQSLPRQIRWKNIIWKGLQQTSEITNRSFRWVCSCSHSVSTPVTKNCKLVSSSELTRVMVGKGSCHRHAT